MITAPPVALTIAGSDCSAGAGIQADLKTFQHFGVHGLTAVTCVVSETANVVNHVHPIPTEIVADQSRLLLQSFPVAAIKTGMLFSSEIVEAVTSILCDFPNIPLVVDPVMIASTGTPLLSPEAIACYHQLLLPRASVITPNLHEAEALLQRSITSDTQLRTAAADLFDLYRCAILLKGGHLEGNICLDLLFDGNQYHEYAAPRIAVPGSHGTGCTLSAAITANLALNHPLTTAVDLAKRYLNQTLQHSYSFHPHSPQALHALNQGTLTP